MLESTDAADKEVAARLRSLEVDTCRGNVDAYEEDDVVRELGSPGSTIAPAEVSRQMSVRRGVKLTGATRSTA